MLNRVYFIDAEPWQMLLNEISCESRARNNQLARNGISTAPGFTLCLKNLLLLFLLAAVQSKELSADLLTLVYYLITSAWLQLQLFKNLFHADPCKLHGHDIAITFINRFQVLQQARQLLFVRLIILFAAPRRSTSPTSRPLHPLHILPICKYRRKSGNIHHRVLPLCF